MKNKTKGKKTALNFFSASIPLGHRVSGCFIFICPSFVNSLAIFFYFFILNLWNLIAYLAISYYSYFFNHFFTPEARAPSSPRVRKSDTYKGQSLDNLVRIDAYHHWSRILFQFCVTLLVRMNESFVYA